MVILGLLLIALGVLAILAALFVSDGSGHLLGIAVTTPVTFIAGVVAGALILWGFTILKYGPKRELRMRKERKQLSELSEKLGRVEAERDDREDS
ncbi:MAG: hypothetical protein R2731_09305 [Nocardioides sp.]